MYDYDQYMSDRGTYFDIKELPFVKLYKIEELKEWLVSEKILGASYDDGDYCEKFIKYDSLDSPAKMLDLVLYGKEDGMIVQDYSENRQKPRRIIHPKKVKQRAILKLSNSTRKTMILSSLRRSGLKICKLQTL